jgi:Helicase associated domain
MSDFCHIPPSEHSQFSVNFDFSSSAIICHKRQTTHDNDRYKNADEDFESNHDKSIEKSLNSQPESSKRARMDESDQNNWTEMFDMLIHFGIQHSHCNVPFNYLIKIGDGGAIIPLGAWLSRQLELERSHSLLPERQQKLQVLIL